VNGSTSIPTFFCRCAVDQTEDVQTPNVPPHGGHGPTTCPGVEALRPDLSAILAEVKCVTSKLRSDESDDEQTSDWKFAAMVIDRLSFWTLTVYLVVVTLAVFGSVLGRTSGPTI